MVCCIRLLCIYITCSAHSVCNMYTRMLCEFCSSRSCYNQFTVLYLLLYTQSPMRTCIWQLVSPYTLMDVVTQLYVNLPSPDLIHTTSEMLAQPMVTLWENILDRCGVCVCVCVHARVCVCVCVIGLLLRDWLYRWADLYNYSCVVCPFSPTKLYNSNIRYSIVYFALLCFPYIYIRRLRFSYFNPFPTAASQFCLATLPSWQQQSQVTTQGTVRPPRENIQDLASHPHLLPDTLLTAVHHRPPGRSLSPPGLLSLLQTRRDGRGNPPFLVRDVRHGAGASCLP